LVAEKRWLKRYRVSIAATVFFVILFGIFYSLVSKGIIAAEPFRISCINCWNAVLFFLKTYYIYILGFIAVLLIIILLWKNFNLGKKFSRLFGKVKSKKLKTKIVKAKPIEILVKPKSRGKIAKELKKKESHKKRGLLKNVVGKWKRRGYDTESLSEKPQKLGQGKMRNLLNKWRKKGYDTDTVS